MSKGFKKGEVVRGRRFWSRFVWKEDAFKPNFFHTLPIQPPTLDQFNGFGTKRYKKAVSGLLILMLLKIKYKTSRK